jgi:hypothetical protein
VVKMTMTMTMKNRSLARVPGVFPPFVEIPTQNLEGCKHGAVSGRAATELWCLSGGAPGELLVNIADLPPGRG